MYKTIIYNENCIPVLELKYLIEFDHFYCRGKYSLGVDEIMPYFDVFMEASKAELYQNDKILTTYWKFKYLQKIKCQKKITKKY